MPLPEKINSETELEDPARRADRRRRCHGRAPQPDILDPRRRRQDGTIARAPRAPGGRARRQRQPRARGVTLFVARGTRGLEADGIPTLACDFTNAPAIAALPRFPNVLFLAGRKFGTTDRTDITWTTNTVVPARVAEHFSDGAHGGVLDRQRLSARAADGPAPTEQDPPMPVGEYAQSCLGRERVVEFVSREQGLRALMFRLNYAVDLRYGTLVDVARKVYAGEPVDLTVGYFNAIWQGDANSYALRSLELCESPPQVLNVTGPERISVRETAEWFGAFFDREPVFVNKEGPVALLSDSSRCRALLGEPGVPLERLRQWVAHWVAAGGRA